MKKLFLFLTISLFALAPAGAQTPQGGDGAAAARTPRQRLVGEVTAVDAATRQLMVRADSGETVAVTTTEQTTYVRMPPGETSLQKGQPAAFADVRVGDRVLAPGVGASGGAARQVILMARAATAAAGGGQGRDDGRRLNGRVVSADAAKKLIVVQTRGREGADSVTVDASAAARVLRFAPDSMRPADAQAGSLADVRPGDNLRATGERSADGRSFKAEEVLTGAFMRFAGTVTKVDAARGELTVKNEQGEQTVTLAFGPHSTLRRATPEFEQVVAQRAERFGRREQRRAASGQGGQGGQAGGGAAREGRRDGERGRRREGEGEQRAGDGGQRRGGGPGGGGGGGNNIQQMVEALPAVALADLKKGNAVVVTVTPSADTSRATVVSLLTGSAEAVRGMQMFQRGGPEGQRGMSPGLPGDVIGGGQGPTREPPR
ncbi:MAG TPA: hypothetical protein VF588_19595 [Pyrinomonadaceae bacterium]|jgi:hypothetical protein